MDRDNDCNLQPERTGMIDDSLAINQRKQIDDEKDTQHALH